MQNLQLQFLQMSLASPLAASPMSVSSPVASPILTVKPAATMVNAHAPVVCASAAPIVDEVDEVLTVKPAATVNAHAPVVRASATPIFDDVDEVDDVLTVKPAVMMVNAHATVVLASATPIVEWPVFVQFPTIVVQFQFPTIVESMNGKMVGTTLSSVSA